MIAGIASGDLAVWLAIGVGCGIAIGAGVGGTLEYKGGKKDAEEVHRAGKEETGEMV